MSNVSTGAPMVEYCSGYSHQEIYYHIEQIGTVYVESIVCIVGAILFAITTAVFSQRKKFNTPAYRLMTAMAIIDFITMTLRAPQGLSTCRLFKWCAEKPFQMYLYIYTVYVEIPLTNTSENISAWLTMAIALERCLTMKNFVRSKSLCSSSQVTTYVCLIICTAVIVNLPMFFLQICVFQYDPSIGREVIFCNFTSFYSSRYYQIYSWVRPVMVQMIPLVFLCVCNIFLIFLVSMKSLNNRQNIRNKSLTTETLEAARKMVANHNQANPSLFCQDTANGHQENLLDPGAVATCSSSRRGSNTTTCSKLLKLNHSNEPTQNSPRVGNSFSGTSATPQSQNAHRRHRAQMKLTILMIVIIGLFIVGQIPQAVAYREVYRVFGGSFDCFYVMFRMITQNLCLTCYCANFFVYLFLNRHFRDTLCSWFAPRCPWLVVCASASNRENWGLMDHPNHRVNMEVFDEERRKLMSPSRNMEHKEL